MKRYIAIFFSLFFVGGVQAQSLRLSHEQCREMALQQSEDLKVAVNAEREAALNYKVARDSRLPRLNGSVNGVYMFSDMDMSGMDFSMHGAYTAGLTLTQPVYVGGKITTGRRLAKIGQEVAKEQQRISRADVIAEIDNAYWTYIAVLEKERMLRSLLNFVEATYTQVESSVSVQMATRADLLRVEASKSDLQYQMEKVKNGSDICRMNLCHLIGVSLDTEIQPADTVVPIRLLAEVVAGGTDHAAIVATRPEYRLLQKQIEAARQQINMTRADYLPTVALSAGYTFYGNMKLKGMAADGMGGYVPYTSTIKDNFGMMMLSVSLPLFNWGEGLRKVKRQRIELENAQYQAEKNARLMNIELTNAHHNLKAAYDMITTAQLGEDQAAEALRVMKDRFEVGLCTLTDLLNAQSQWQSARSNLIESRTQYKIYETDYLRAAGRLQAF